MKKLFTVALAILAVLAFASTSVLGAEGTISSTVQIATPVAVVGEGSLNFGYLSAPTNANCDYWTIDAFTGILSHGGAGNGIDFIPGDHSQGDFTITGAYIDGEMVTFSVVVTTDFADPNINLSTLTLYPLPVVNLDAPLLVNVGGTLEVCPGATSALHTDAVVTLTADYSL